MRIAIDYRLAATTTRGMGRYCREIVNELFSIDRENEYYLITTEIPKEIQLPQNFRFIQIKKRNYIGLKPMIKMFV